MNFFKQILILLITITSTINIYSQDCNITSKANDIIPDKLCAPVSVVWEVTYRGVTNAGTPVRIQFNWDDGNPVEIINAVNTNPAPAIREWKATINHVYPQGGNKCNYNPTATLMVNGVLCSSSIQQQNVTVWDTDDENGGEVAINPDVFPICVGNDGGVTFQDVSIFNCVPPIENDNPNTPTRWTQWIYGTGYTINNVQVNGAVRVYPYYGAIVPLPGPVIGPGPPNNVSLPCYSPNTALVNQYFQVTLRNWNYCNPYDDPLIPGPPVDLANGDYPPVITTAIILIVPRPNATITPAGPFCQSHAAVNLTAATGGGTWSGPGITNASTGRFNPSVAGPGTHTITYTVTDANGCSGTDTEQIIVWADPVPHILPGTNLEVCPGDPLVLNGNPTAGSGVITTHLWTGSTSPLNATNIQSPTFTTNSQGNYNLTYTVTDNNGCKGSQNAVVAVNPVSANITVTQACAGVDITVNGNPSGGTHNYVTHIWTGSTGYLSNTNTFNPVFNAPSSGTYTLTYTVTDNNGCTGSDQTTITVFSVPVSEAGNNDTICGLDYGLHAIPSIGSGTWTLTSGAGTATFSNLHSPISNVSVSAYGDYTFTWTETYGASCMDNDLVKIKFIQQPNANAGLDGTVCGKSFNINAVASVGTGAWTMISGTGVANISNIHSPTTVVTVDNYGSYQFEWRENNGYSCIDADTVTVNFDVVPTPAFDPITAHGCSPFLVNFENNTIGGVSYLWIFGDGSTSTLSNPSHVFFNATASDVAFNVKLIAWSIYGCVDSITQIIVVNPIPSSNFVSDATPACSPVTVNFTNASSGAISYEWIFGDGSSNETSTNVTHTFVNNQMLIQYFDVRLVVTSNNGCTDTSSRFVTVYPDPSNEFTVSPDSGCHPLLAQFTSSPGAQSYNWSFGDGTSENGTYQANHIFSNNTNANQNYTITLITNSFFGCKDTSQKNITVHPKPNAIFSIPQSAGCSPLVVAFNNLSQDAQTYSWDFGDGTFDTQLNPIHQYTNNLSTPSTFTISMIATNSYGCSDSTSHTLTVYPKVDAVFISDTVGCSPVPITFINQSTGTDTYHWSFGDGQTSIIKTPAHVFSNTTVAPAIYPVTLISSSLYGCKDTAYSNITIYPSLFANFTIINPAGCSPFIAQFNNQSQNAQTYIWSFGDGTTATAEDTTHLYTNNQSAPSSYTVNLVAVNAWGCRDSVQRNLSVFPEVTAQFSSDTVGCSPVSITFTNLSYGTDTYHWNFGDGQNSTLKNPNHVFTNTLGLPVTYPVTLVSASIYGCTDTAYGGITVYPAPDAQFNVNPITQEFPSSLVMISNNTNAGSWTYLWNFGDSTTSSLAAPGSHTYLSWGTYIIHLTVSNEYCTDETSTNIYITAPTPQVVYGSSKQACPPLDVQFTNNSIYSESYFWEFGDGSVSTLKEPSHTYYDPGTYIVSLTASGPGGTDTENSVVITVYEIPTAYFNVMPTVVFLPDDPISCDNLSQNASTYLWNFGDGTTSSEFEPTHIYKNAGEFDITLIASTEHQCIDTFTIIRAVTAEASGEIKFPNAFSPNQSGSTGGTYDDGDYSNDVFHPIMKGVVEYELSILNRWGELIFESKDIKIGWDGYYKGKPCKQDVYVWKVKGRFANGKNFIKAGDVTLIR